VTRVEAVEDPREGWRLTLVEAGFTDFDTLPMVVAFREIAATLTKIPLDDFDAVNEWIGTRNGVASGWVTMRVRDLEQRGYLTVLPGGGVRLTDRGLTAARALGFEFTS
jgi:hypothetical protein